MKLKTIIIAICSAFIISGCTKNMDEIQTTATHETIALAKERLKDIKPLKVTDNGVIYFRKYIPNNQYWLKNKIKAFSDKIACHDLRWYVEHGMTVRVAFQGSQGMIEDYDQKRCQTVLPLKNEPGNKNS